MPGAVVVVLIVFGYVVSAIYYARPGGAYALKKANEIEVKKLAIQQAEINRLHERESKLSKMTPEERRHFEVLEKLDELKEVDRLSIERNLSRQNAQRMVDNGNPNKPGSAAWSESSAAWRRNHR